MACSVLLTLNGTKKEGRETIFVLFRQKKSFFTHYLNVFCIKMYKFAIGNVCTLPEW